jgi:hypothetical protein
LSNYFLPVLTPAFIVLTPVLTPAFIVLTPVLTPAFIVLTPAFTAAGEAEPASGELATMAFLVVFRLLINDFFWMLMARSLSLVLISSTERFPLEHGPCQTRRAHTETAKCTNLHCLVLFPGASAIVPERRKITIG